MNKLNPNVVALSLGFTAVIVYSVCLILVALLPLETIVTFTNYLVHGIDFSNIAVKNITTIGAVIGLIEAFIMAWIIGYIFASVYNWCTGRFNFLKE